MTIKAHQHDWTAQRFAPTEWNDAISPDIDAGRTTGRLRSCSFCGSMHPADLAVALQAGATMHFADRKYGWPHKSYVEGVPNPHAGQMESRMSASHVLPLCPKSGEACTHGEQSFHHPVCDCMKSAEPTEATHGTTRMVRIKEGFSRGTGAPEFRWTEAGKPAAATTHGKFYTEHLQDASPEDLAVIERAMGLHFEFTLSGAVSWKPIL